MTLSPKPKLDPKKLLGATLLPFGLLLLLVNVESGLAASGSSFGLASADVDDLPSLAFSLFHLVQSYFFDHASFLHGLGQILVSCWPIILILTAIVLLQNAVKSQVRHRIAEGQASNIGGRS
jgi:hypothetical protein